MNQPEEPNLTRELRKETPGGVMTDVQGRADDRQLAINRVGVRGLRHPLCFRLQNGGTQNTVAQCDLAVALPHDRKGTHMSRFVALLHERQEPLDGAGVAQLLTEMAERLDAGSAELALAFDLFLEKSAPASGVRSLMDYAVTWHGRYADGALETGLRVAVPVTSLCPCSKEISDYGAHNQRSQVTLDVQVTGELWPEQLIHLAESQASAPLYGILKRPDEKFVTEQAYDNPKFVEDMVRDVAAAVSCLAGVGHYRVEVENFESIHNHSAYAWIESPGR